MNISDKYSHKRRKSASLLTLNTVTLTTLNTSIMIVQFPTNSQLRKCYSVSWLRYQGLILDMWQCCFSSPLPPSLMSATPTSPCSQYSISLPICIHHSGIVYNIFKILCLSKCTLPRLSLDIQSSIPASFCPVYFIAFWDFSPYLQSLFCSHPPVLFAWSFFPPN